jgi:hypothetical protein
MASSTTTVKRDPYADLPRVPDFPLESSVVADGETMALAPECCLGYRAAVRRPWIAHMCSQLLWLTASAGSIA